LSPYSGYRLKTAIDPTTGRAKDSQLFGYQHLNKGQYFFGSIVFDNDFDNALQETIKDQLQGCLRLGRSKSSQYGRVSLQWLDKVSAQSKRLTSNTGNQTTDKKITLWCLSDCCLYDTETGQPILQIQARHLGLEGDIIPDQTFIRTRRYIPYNAYRRGHELERQVISKGSVISIQLKEAIDEQSLIALETQGIGLYKEQGLGQIAINHPWLAVNYQPVAKEQVQKIEQEKESIVINVKDSPLLHWLEQQDSPDQRLQQHINDVIDTLKHFYQTGRCFSAVTTQQSYGLSTTQWGHLYDIAKSNRTIEQLNYALFSASDALCKFEHNEEWTLPRNEKGHSMTDWLMTEFQKLQEKVAEQLLTERDISLILTRVAKKARIQNEQWLKGDNLSTAGDENK
jgi:CRISPR/Cas system CSM-associated protein Csm3 (group 7 of RAMP superfamily)